ncbi:lysophospholipase [Corynebacterium sp. 153RC1]|uniref:lysophospholipase n=1 Tax=unclassified Corynebacterium TaxID=2624378 RepID=UPI00211C6912|nr:MULTISPECIES: lysophospholipase [unclassified Corynebacterium]MCQ9352659.1 lysophospholipase [Corynebacterium sp. 209RC1]MCQ9354843.1 lysophospholipase [Corynebacterium sp. 1222RC1]MCQ9357028.1 lysophospholipase [Corynebacterium sp. 122RC1]MCQ9359274.1 lysophospholipase [Corynebacterium sp. 142RC1]MCQ9361496.1 lysophospholipase [Corynebacterium sp. 153RC1]
MALHEFTLASANGRDDVRAWVYVPVGTPRGIVQVVHGLGEHSRRYLHLISTLLDHGFAVAATDHVGHGATGAASGIWQDTGEGGWQVYVADEHTLAQRAQELVPGVPFFMYGHSWGSLIARAYARAHGTTLAGLILGGVPAGMQGVEQYPFAAELAAADPAGAAGELAGPVFAGMNERFGEGAGPTDWVAADPDVVADHLADPLNNFAAQMTARFLRDFLDIYAQANDPGWEQDLPKDLGVLILAGDQDPVTNYGEGAYALANALRRGGVDDVTTRVFTGSRHEVHNEAATRAEAERLIVEFVEARV